jgi:hypothetical protein
MRWSASDYAKARIEKEAYTPDPKLTNAGNKIMEMTDGGAGVGQKSGILGTAIKKGIVDSLVKAWFSKGAK